MQTLFFFQQKIIKTIISNERKIKVVKGFIFIRKIIFKFNKRHQSSIRNYIAELENENSLFLRSMDLASCTY